MPAIDDVAQEEEDPSGDDAIPAAAAGPSLGLTYHGVAPGEEHLPPRPPRLPAKGPTKITWPGFRVQGGVPQVFLELTGPVVWSVAESEGKLVYTLLQTTIPLANNRRPLRVEAFKTAVRDVEARQRGRDVEITIRLKGRVSHKERTEQAAGGYKFLVIELFPS
jgi:hypothetical protein